jgi:uncharacterized protein DUF6150
MRKLLLFLCLVIPAGVCQAQMNGNCDVYGQIFVTEIPQQAHYRVFIDDSEAFANLVVFEEENALMADREGMWFFTNSRGLANFSIYFTENKSDADFTIFYTDIPGFAGCN